MHEPICRITLSELAEHHDLRFNGNGDTLIDGIGTLSDATPSQLSFLSNPAYRDQLKTTQAAAVILTANDADDCPVNSLVADDPYVAYANIAGRFDPRRPAVTGIHDSACVDPGASLGDDVHVGANAVIGPGCEIADAASIGPGCILAADCKVGQSSRLVAGVTVCEGVSIGKRVIIHPGAVIGADGFGLAFDRDHWLKIPQLGGVQIGDDCEIGANTTIDRGAIGDTIIANDVRLDNQIQIGHNVKVGAHTAMAGMVGISGSTRIGEYCMFAGASGTAGHLNIADRTTVQAQSVITRSINTPGTVWSSTIPAQPARDWNRSMAHLRRLDKLVRRVLKLEKKRDKAEK